MYNKAHYYEKLFTIICHAELLKKNKNTLIMN